MRKKSIKTNPTRTQMLELVEKDTKRVVITVLHVFTKLNRDMENIKRYHSRFGGLNIQCLKFKKIIRWD